MASGKNTIPDMTDDLELVQKDPVAGGSYSDVYKYKDKKDRFMAVKVIRKACINEAKLKGYSGILSKASLLFQSSQFTLLSFCQLQRMTRETHDWHVEEHPNVLGFLGVIYRDRKDETLPSFVALWMENGDARRYLDTPAGQATNFLEFVSIETLQYIAPNV